MITIRHNSKIFKTNNIESRMCLFVIKELSLEMVNKFSNFYGLTKLIYTPPHCAGLQRDVPCHTSYNSIRAQKML